MSMKEIENTITNTSSSFQFNHQQQALNVRESTYTNGSNRIREKARTRIFYFKDIRLTDLVGVKKG